DVPGAVARGHHPAPLHPPGRDALRGVVHDRRSEMAALGLLLHPARSVLLLAAVSVLLDAGDEFPARQRALPAVDGAELHAVLDAASDTRPRPLSARRDFVQHLDAEHADNLDR